MFSAPHLRRSLSVIDEESERAVARWVRLGDQVAGSAPAIEERPFCGRCGTKIRVLDGSEQALCARCYLERGSIAAR